MLNKTLLLCSAIILCACSLLNGQEIKEPKIEVSEVKVEEVGLMETTLGFYISVDNPSPMSFDLKKLTYDLLLNNKKLSAGTQKFDKKIKAQGITKVKVPLTLKNTELLSVIGQLAKNQKTPYKISGTVTVGVLPIPFENQGELSTAEWFSLE